MKRSSFLKRSAGAAVALTAGASLIPKTAEATTVNWERPLVQVHPDGRHTVLWWPGKDEHDVRVAAHHD